MSKNYKICREFTKRDLWVELDTDKVIQVLDNILNNAIKYSPDGGVITCRLVETHNNVVFSISDQGLGIPKRSRESLRAFYRVDKARARAQGGTGLGLAISKEVIRAHNGVFGWKVQKVKDRLSIFHYHMNLMKRIGGNDEIIRMDYKNWLDFDGHFKYIFSVNIWLNSAKNTRNEVGKPSHNSCQ